MTPLNRRGGASAQRCPHGYQVQVFYEVAQPDPAYWLVDGDRLGSFDAGSSSASL